MSIELRMYSLGLEVVTVEYPRMISCGIQYGYIPAKGLYVYNVGLMVLVSAEENEMISHFGVDVVVDEIDYIREEPIPVNQREDAGATSSKYPDERIFPIRN